MSTPATSSSLRLLVLPHWRPEVDDIVRTIRDALAHSGQPPLNLERRHSRLPSRRLTERAVAILASDAKRSRALDRALRSGGQTHVFRLWWNGSDEILAYTAQQDDHERDVPETSVCFFPEVAPELVGTDVDLICVPYAFAAPERPPQHYRAAVAYTGEVDISDSCFTDAGIAPDRTKRYSDLAWGLAGQVTQGDLTLVGADELLRSPSESPAAPFLTMLWAVRNRVRYLLLKDVVAAFPGRVELRGSDWRRLGFDARRTTFRRRARMSDYRRCRVSLDLGSKSTHAALYPRTADIMAVAGGIVQFDSGEPLDWSPALMGRRVRSIPDLLALIDKLLSASERDLSRENQQLQDDYAQMRLRAGRTLVHEIDSRTC